MSRGRAAGERRSPKSRGGAARVLAIVGTALMVLSCASSRSRQYRNGDLDLLSAYTAKEVCSCVFVLEQSEEFCRAWTRANPAVAGFTVDRAAKTVESSALIFWGAKARFVSDRFGCVLE